MLQRRVCRARRQDQVGPSIRHGLPRRCAPAVLNHQMHLQIHGSADDCRRSIRDAITAGIDERNITVRDIKPRATIEASPTRKLQVAGFYEAQRRLEDAGLSSGTDFEVCNRPLKLHGKGDFTLYGEATPSGPWNWILAGERFCAEASDRPRAQASQSAPQHEQRQQQPPQQQVPPRPHQKQKTPQTHQQQAHQQPHQRAPQAQQQPRQQQPQQTASQGAEVLYIGDLGDGSVTESSTSLTTASTKWATAARRARCCPRPRRSRATCRCIDPSFVATHTASPLALGVVLERPEAVCRRPHGGLGLDRGTSFACRRGFGGEASVSDLNRHRGHDRTSSRH